MKINVNDKVLIEADTFIGTAEREQFQVTHNTNGFVIGECSEFNLLIVELTNGTTGLVDRRNVRRIPNYTERHK